MGFSYPLEYRFKVVEQLLDGVPTAEVLARESIQVQSLYRWMRKLGVRMRRAKSHKVFGSVVFPPQLKAAGQGAVGHQDKLNARPRVILNGHTPAEKLEQLLTAVALNP